MLLEGILLIATCYLFLLFLSECLKHQWTPRGSFALPVFYHFFQGIGSLYVCVNKYREKYKQLLWDKTGSKNILMNHILQADIAFNDHPLTIISCNAASHAETCSNNRISKRNGNNVIYRKPSTSPSEQRALRVNKSRIESDDGDNFTYMGDRDAFCHMGSDAFHGIVDEALLSDKCDRDVYSHIADCNSNNQHLRGYLSPVKEIARHYGEQSARPRVQTDDYIPPLRMSEELAASIAKLTSEFNPGSGTSYSTETEKNIGRIREVNIIDRINSIQDSSFKKMYLENIQRNQKKMEQNCEKGDMKMRYLKYSRDISLDWDMADLQMDKLKCYEYTEMVRKRMKLPSFGMRKQILSIINSNQCVVLSGDTGCGKTTQVPQFILDDRIFSNEASTCRIVCTQPRRISAISVANRVADERAETLGISVGYQIRLQKVLPRTFGSILYCTTGVVLQWLQSDPFLRSVSHLIIDEVHERDSLSDFLLCVAKELLPYRPDLKVILMSATVNAEKFSDYFGNCPKIHIPRQIYPVQEYFLEDVIEELHFRYPLHSAGKLSYDESFKKVLEKISDLENTGKYSSSTINELIVRKSESISYELIVELVRQIHKKPPGAVLIFVPGLEEILKIAELLEKDFELGNGSTLVIPLHSLMPTVNQSEVFDKPQEGIRKIIVSTNIAETSITIEDVVYVIDSGKTKTNKYNYDDNVATLQSEWVTWANATQRKGRAGRVKEGICYHLFTRARGSLLDDYPLPEIQRTRLENIILKLKSLQLGSAKQFLSKVMEPPDSEMIQISLKLLVSINALDSKENLTPLGFHLARLPVDPFVGKMLLTAALFSCLDPILTIAASLDFKDPFIIPIKGKDKVNCIRKQLDDNNQSDHLTIATAYEKWENAEQRGKGRNFAFEHFLSIKVMYQLRKLRNQFMNILCQYNFISTTNPYDQSVNKNSHNLGLLKAVLTAGLNPNVAMIYYDPGNKWNVGLLTRKGTVSIHPKSVNSKHSNLQSQWLVYWKKMRTSKLFLYDTTIVNNYAVLLFGEQFSCDESRGLIVIKNFGTVRCDKDMFIVMRKLRNELDSFLDHKISHPSQTNWDPKTKEGYLLKLVIHLLSEKKKLPTSVC